MRKIASLMSVFILSLASVAASATNTDEPLPTVEQVREVIFGDWQVMSFQREDGERVDYSGDNIIWSFGDNYRASIGGAGFTPL